MALYQQSFSVFSTYVEVILIQSTLLQRLCRFLHVCGGDPAVSKLEDVKTLVSYNIDYNIPDALRNKYQEVDVMELFANVIKEPMYAVDETYAYTDEDWKNNDVKRDFVGYKWQK